jgi:hypothetical protein
MKLWVWWLSVLGLMIFIIGVLLFLLSVNNLFLHLDTIVFNLLNRLIPKLSAGPALWWSLFSFGLYCIINGLLLFYIANSPFKKMKKWAWLAVFTLIMVWFTAGACLSIIFVIYIDMILYAIILFLTLLPLLFTQKAFIITRDLS